MGDVTCGAAVPERLADSGIRGGSIGVPVLPPAFCGPYFCGSRSACCRRTFFHSTPSSSAINIGIDVFTPWPTSGFLAMMVTMLSGVMRMNALGVKSAAPWSNADTSTAVAISKPPPAIAVTRKKSRRVRG